VYLENIPSDLKDRLRSAGVNLKVDTVFCLVKIRAIEKGLQGVTPLHAVRFLIMFRPGTQLRVDLLALPDLTAWHKHEKSCFDKMVANLIRAAKDDEVINTANFKRIRKKGCRGLNEVRAGGEKARLFYFHDTDKGRTIVTTGAYRKQGRARQKEHIAQDRAIDAAGELMHQWRAADPVAQLDGFRVLKGRV
jgi:hypothetical protein